ncbi:MAG: GspH/FimT family pseudopilin [Burkholderiales bacterium]|jgi:type IV fimbrial biogenesis protein FimT|nr:GspH/FimT family pseudopilin [Burkholderiales bacterium]
MLNRIHSGFSLIELIVGLAILASLMALGLPQYATFIANSRLRATAEGITNGLNLARAEAVKRNARVELVLTDEEPIEGLVNALPASTSGFNWVVREWVPATGAYNFIEGKVGAEGSGKSQGTGVVIASSSADATYDGRIIFTGFGAMAIGQPISFQVTYPAAGACAAANGPLRCLNVNVSPGGQIRICDPKITDTKDTRAC